MTPEFTFYGLDFSELVLFGILFYLAALILVVILVRCALYRMFCPFSGDCVHCTYFNCCCACPNCSMRQSATSILCCKRNHSVYKLGGCDVIPSCGFNCFKPDCNYLRCCCCEFFVQEEKLSQQKPNKVIDI